MEGAVPEWALEVIFVIEIVLRVRVCRYHL